MKLRFSRAADYGLRAALEIARAADGSLVTRHAIAKATGAPTAVLAQSLAALVRAGLLDAQAGPRGGYRLARAAGETSIHDLVIAIDGQPGEQRCVLRNAPCPGADVCPFHAFLAQAQERFLETLRETTLADVIAGLGTAPLLASPGARR
jgi:Rrf2 family protein